MRLLDRLERDGVPFALATKKVTVEFTAIGNLPFVERFPVVSRPNEHYDEPTKTILVADAIKRLNVSADKTGVMVSDRASDIKAGKANGLRTIAATWGAGTLEELKAENPDDIAHSIAVLAALLGYEIWDSIDIKVKA